MNNKNNFLFVILLVIVLLTPGIVHQAQQNVEPVKLSENLYLIPIYGVNSLVLLNNHEALIVDAGYEQAEALLKSELNKLGADKVKYLINTHWHFDHVGGNKYLGEEAEIFAHTTVRKFLSQDEMILGEMQKKHPANSLPEITLEGKITIYFANERVNLIPLTGGHTGGDVVVYFENENVLHIGDIIFADMFPFVDVDHGGSVFKMRDNILSLIEMMPEDVTIIPGHGRNYSVADASKYCEMIEKTTTIVNESIEKGMSLEEMKQDEILSEWSEWDKGFTCNDWIEMIFKSKK